MKIINYYELSSFGYGDNNNKYYISQDGIVINSNSGDVIKPDINHSLFLTNQNGKIERIQLKELYQITFNQNYCIDFIPSLDGEIWLPMVYQDSRLMISSYGRIKSLRGYHARLLAFEDNKEGYQRVKINKRHYSVSRLVGIYFVDGYKQGYQLHHKDGCRSNNTVSNLIWLSVEEHKKIHNRGGSNGTK